MQLNIQENDDNISPITYDDILSKMGMFVSNGRLHFTPTNNLNNPNNPNNSNNSNNNSPNNNQKNSYIYNKYFNDNNDTKPKQYEIRKPKTFDEYKTMVLQDYIQKQKIKQIKSTKLIIPTLNIHISNNNNNLSQLLFQL